MLCEGRRLKRNIRIGFYFLSIIRRGAGNLFRLEDHFLFAGQLVLHLFDDQFQVTGMRDVVQVVGRDSQHRAKCEVFDPLFVEIVQPLQIIGQDLFFVVRPRFEMRCIRVGTEALR